MPSQSSMSTRAMAAPRAEPQLRAPNASPNATLLPGTPLKKIPTPAEVLAARDEILSGLLAETRDMRQALQEVLRAQRQMLEVLSEAVRQADPDSALDDLLGDMEEGALLMHRQ